MDSDDEEFLKNISNMDWEEDSFTPSSSGMEDQSQLIAQSTTFEDCDPPSTDHLETLSKCFGHKSFRPMQWKIINSIINERRDTCAVMATGYGKSLCFQYPSVYCGGLTIVISPLISLMEDQVLSLKMANIPACFLGSAQTKQHEVIQGILEDKYSLVYVTPEFCCGAFGSDLLKRIDNKVSITLIAIDEAHCVSTWGHDFRFQYRELGQLRSILPHVPILAVTATATTRVRNDIVKSLYLKNPLVLCSGFDRPNLYFSVFLKGNRGALEDLKKYMVKENHKLTFTGSTIIYCITRKQTEEVANLLNMSGIKCATYHGNMSIKARTTTHEDFVRDKVKVIVATIAFGMGIDKPDVRRIIHYGSSKDLESYYQEVGRAGRDGQPAECVTFYSHADFNILRSIREQGYGNEKNKAHKEKMAQMMEKYFDTRECRRQFILNHFEGTPNFKKPPKPMCCDNCTRKLTEKSDCQKYEGLDSEGRYDFTEDAHTFLAAVRAMGGRFGAGSYILFLRGSKSAKISKFQKNSLHGSGKLKSEDWWKGIGQLLLRENFLQKNTGSDRFVCTIGLSKKGEQYLSDIIQKPQLAKLLIPPSKELFKLLKLKQVKREIVVYPKVTTELKKPTTPRTSLSSLSDFKAANKLQLLKQPVPSQPTIQEPGTNEEEESEEEKQERMQVFKVLMNKRIELASKMDCMPYMVASNEALMKMAQFKPLSMNELRECELEGFNEAKLKKFGPELIRTMRILCNLDPDIQEQKRSIEDILVEHPLPGAKIGNSALVTYAHFKNGLTISEIAEKRGVIVGTIISHLTDAMKMGFPIKTVDLNVTDEERNIVLNVIKGPKINSDMSTITPIKMACPEHISFQTVKIVVAYVQVREHLKTLGLPYEEFEESYDDVLTYALACKGKSPIDTLIDLGKDMMDDSNDYDKLPDGLNQSASPSIMGKIRKRVKPDDYDSDGLLESPPASPKRPVKTIKKPIQTEVKNLEETDNHDTIHSPVVTVKKKRRRIIGDSTSDSDETIITSPVKTSPDMASADELLDNKNVDDCDFDKEIDYKSPTEPYTNTVPIKDDNIKSSFTGTTNECSMSDIKKSKQFTFKKPTKAWELPSWL